MPRVTVARVAEGLGLARDTTNYGVLTGDERALIAVAARFDTLRIPLVDEDV